MPENVTTPARLNGSNVVASDPAEVRDRIGRFLGSYRDGAPADDAGRWRLLENIAGFGTELGLAGIENIEHDMASGFGDHLRDLGVGPADLAAVGRFAASGTLTGPLLLAKQDAEAEQTARTESQSHILGEDLRGFLARGAKLSVPGWLVGGLIPDEGIALWHGQPRDFKSLVALEVALGLAAGRTPLENHRFKVEKAVKVAFIGEEDGERLFLARVNWLTATRSMPAPGMFLPSIRKGLSFDSSTDQNALIAALSACGAEVAFFDPLRSFTQAADRGPSDLGMVVRFLRRVQTETMAKSIVMVHHDVKPAAYGGVVRSRSQQASGGGIFSISDCPVAFQKVAWNRVACFPEDFKLSGDPTPFEVTFTTDAQENESGAPVFGTWVLPVATTKAEDQMVKDRHEPTIKAYLAAHPWSTAQEIEVGAKVGKDGEVARCLAGLVTTGVVVMVTGQDAKALNRSARAKLHALKSATPSFPPTPPNTPGGSSEMHSPTTPTPSKGGVVGRESRSTRATGYIARKRGESDRPNKGRS